MKRIGFQTVRYFLPALNGSRAQGAFERAGIVSPRSANLRTAATYRLAAMRDGSIFRRPINRPSQEGEKDEAF